MKALLSSIFILVSLYGFSQSIVTVVGNGVNTYNGNNLSALESQIGPNGITVSKNGTIYFADVWNNRIRMVTSDRKVITIAGTGERGYSGNGGPATNAKLGELTGICVDSAGNVYFAEWENHTIRKVGKDGIISHIAGVAGFVGFSGDNGPASNAKLSAPFGIGIDNFGSIFFSDVGNSCIRKIDATGKITTVAGTPTIAGYGGDGGPATDAKLDLPGFLTIATNGDLYWAEWPNYVIRKLNVITGTISTVAGNGTSGNAGDGGMATAATFLMPTGVSIDSDGNIYVADKVAQLIRKVDASTGIISKIAGNGTTGYSGDDGPATLASLNNPNNLTVDRYHNIYICDALNFRIRRINFDISSATDIPLRNHFLTPNPASNFVNLEGANVARSIQLFDVSGRKINREIEKLSDQSVVIHIGDLPPNIYIVFVDEVLFGYFTKI